MQRDALLIDGITHTHTHTHTQIYTSTNRILYIVILNQHLFSLPYLLILLVLVLSYLHSTPNTFLRLSHIYFTTFIFHISGEIIYGGDRGAEGVLGALVRHLLDKTEILKNYSLSPDYQCRYVRTCLCVYVRTYVCDVSTRHFSLPYILTY
jgi:hypothetical protein